MVCRKQEIYLAGGCFWGMQKYLDLLKGVMRTEVGYANGETENPTYEEVCYQHTGHAETVFVEYDEEIISLEFLLSMYFDAIDPTAVNRQGGDTGIQYRTGIYYTDSRSVEIIQREIAKLQEKFSNPIAIEVLPLKNFSKAEEYHQQYLDKNPEGYCHINAEKMRKARQTADRQNREAKHYHVPKKEEIKQMLTEEQFAVTQENGTEPPFHNAYWNHFQKGIYVDIVTGEPLFLSKDKFASSCGWPSFSKPVSQKAVHYLSDTSFGMERTEVRSQIGDSHLGHVFEDGPKENGGKRYCINSASMRFIPAKDLEKQGYGFLLPLLEEE